MALDVKKFIKLDFILKLSLLKKVLILAGISIVIAVFFFNFMIKPKLKNMAELRVKTIAIAAQLKENRSIAKDIPRFNREKEELEIKLKKALSQLPNEKEIPNLIESISNAGKNAGLKILLFRPKPDVNRGFYAEVPVAMNVEGTYESVFNFCKKVSELSRIVNIEGISLKMPSKAGKQLSSNPILKSSFVATTFRFIPESEQKKNTSKRKKKRGRKRR
jgi:type IV pilus assembly protein PilO